MENNPPAPGANPPEQNDYGLLLSQQLLDIGAEQPITDRRESDGPAWHVTYLDTVTILLTLMLLILALQNMNEERRDAVSQALRNTTIAEAQRAPLPPVYLDPTRLGSIPPDLPTSEFQDLLELNQFEDMVEVSSDSRQITLNIKEALLFPSGQADLSDLGRRFITTLGPTLQNSPGEIVVEGHTDNVPIATVRFPSNWELSSARAAAVVREMINFGLEPNRLRAVGYADTQPIADNDTEQGRANNRRVTVSIRYFEDE